jgi:hypothetical protein
MDHIAPCGGLVRLSQANLLNLNSTVVPAGQVPVSIWHRIWDQPEIWLLFSDYSIYTNCCISPIGAVIMSPTSPLLYPVILPNMPCGEKFKNLGHHQYSAWFIHHHKPPEPKPSASHSLVLTQPDDTAWCCLSSSLGQMWGNRGT